MVVVVVEIIEGIVHPHLSHSYLAIPRGPHALCMLADLLSLHFVMVVMVQASLRWCE